MTITPFSIIPNSVTSPTSFDSDIDTLLSELNPRITQANTMAAAMNAIAAGGALSAVYTFSTTTTDADPGAGILRFDNATQNAATTIRADLLGSDARDMTNVLATFDDSTSTVKGYINLYKASDETAFIVFSVSAMASPSGYRNITVAVVASSATNPFADADALVMEFTRTGDKGETGAAGVVTLVRSARTSNTILGVADNGTLIDITSGTFSQTFTAAATLGSGWCCYIRNSGTGDVTLDPDASEQIDGLTSYVMYPGETRLIQCTGTAFFSVVLSSFYKTFTTTDTFVKPPGYQLFGGLKWSGGGSGSKGAASTNRTGGSGAACSKFEIPAASLGATETVTIGAGGAAQTTNSTDGNIGGVSDFAGISSGAGLAGSTGNAVNGGTAYTTGNSNVLGADVNHVFVGSITASESVPGRAFLGGGGARTGTPNGSVYGGGAGGSINSSNNVLAVGTSILGGDGGAASGSGNATDGTAPGGGGGAAVDSVGNSGAGARGEMRIWGIA